MTTRSIMRLLVLAAVTALAAGQTASAGSYTANWCAYGGSWNGTWEDPNHWYPHYVFPDNATAGHQWTVSLDAGWFGYSVSYYVEVSESHTVTSIISNSAAGHKVELTNWTGPRLWLQFNSFTNNGTLDVNNIDLYGPITNAGDWTARGGMANYNGNVANAAGAVFRVRGNLEAKGTFTNDGEVEACTGGALWADTLDNNDRLSLLGEAIGSVAELDNPAGSVIAGAGSLHTPGGLDSAGVVRAESGALSVYAGDGTILSTGTLEAGPNAALFLDADAVTHQGTLTVRAGGGVTLTRADLQNPAGAAVTILGGTLAAPHITHDAGAAFEGFGTIDLPGDGSGPGTLTNKGAMEFVADTRVVGHFDNQAGATLTGRNGDFTVVGDFRNNGQIAWENGGVYWEGTYTGSGDFTLTGAEAKTLSGAMALPVGGGLSVAGTGPATVYADLDSAGTVTVAPEATAVFRGNLSGAGTYHNDGVVTFDGSAGSPAVSVGAIEGAGRIALTDGVAVAAAGLQQRSVTVADGCSLTVGPDGVALVGPLDVDAADLASVVFEGPLDNTAGQTLTKTGDGTLVITGPQSHAAGAVFHILGGTVEMDTDAGGTGLMDDADLSVLVDGAELVFGCDQHLDTLDIRGDGLVRLTGADVVVVRNLVMNGAPLGPTTLTPEPATLALVAAGAVLLLRRPRSASRRG
jgi:autotransporter-associated beta strand protein